MTSNTSFAELLASAVTEPGIISTAYQQFHNYSLGNQLLAWSQCLERGIQPEGACLQKCPGGNDQRQGQFAAQRQRPVPVGPAKTNQRQEEHIGQQTLSIHVDTFGGVT